VDESPFIPRSSRPNAQAKPQALHRSGAVRRADGAPPRAVVVGRTVFRAGRRLLWLLILTGCWSARLTADEAQPDWFEEHADPPVPQVGPGELVFLAPTPAGRLLHVENRLVIDGRSLTDGWVNLEQCYRGLDPVSDTEIVYAYREMRGLQLLSARRIGKASVHPSSIELHDVGAAAELCVAAEVRILLRNDDGVYTLRNGPFHRRFLDGFFPMRVTLEVRYPGDRLRLLSVSPAARTGVRIERFTGRFAIDVLFAGALVIEARLSE
jgi:hypothetical protein